MPVPEWPQGVRETLTNLGLGELYSWWQDFSSFINSRLDTRGDVRLVTGGRGIILTNASGTVTKRVRLNDAGTGLVFEDV